MGLCAGSSLTAESGDVSRWRYSIGFDACYGIAVASIEGTRRWGRGSAAPPAAPPSAGPPSPAATPASGNQRPSSSVRKSWLSTVARIPAVPTFGPFIWCLRYAFPREVDPSPAFGGKFDDVIQSLRSGNDDDGLAVQEVAMGVSCIGRSPCQRQQPSRRRRRGVAPIRPRRINTGCPVIRDGTGPGQPRRPSS